MSTLVIVYQNCSKLLIISYLPTQHLYNLHLQHFKHLNGTSKKMQLLIRHA